MKSFTIVSDFIPLSAISALSSLNGNRLLNCVSTQSGQGRVKQMMAIFQRTRDSGTGEVNCPQVERNLEALKEHLAEDNKQSQLRTQPNGGGRAPNVNIGDLGV